VKNFSIVNGVLNGAKQALSPNYNLRPNINQINLLVIHNISLPPRQYGGGYVEKFFQNTLPVAEHTFFEEIKDLQVSAHLFISRLGEVIQFVNLNDRAWHAGVSVYEGRENCNDFSIGIELEGCDEEAYSNVQYEVLAKVSVAIEASYPNITAQSTHGHSDIAPGRKTDPGPFFNWQKYRQMWQAGDLNAKKLEVE